MGLILLNNPDKTTISEVDWQSSWVD